MVGLERDLSHIYTTVPRVSAIVESARTDPFVYAIVKIQIPPIVAHNGRIVMVSRLRIVVST